MWSKNSFGEPSSTACRTPLLIRVVVFGPARPIHAVLMMNLTPHGETLTALPNACMQRQECAVDNGHLA
jgi:hypothetical protein